MRKITLKNFAEEVGQANAATQLGVRQSAISKAIRLNRRIFITLNADGSIDAEEIKIFPTQKQGVENAA
jgi:hypothetical protein